MNKPQTISAALRLSPEWKAWEKYAYQKHWDWGESNDTGWMSDEHFAAFMDFVRSTVRKTETKKQSVITVHLIDEDVNK